MSGLPSISITEFLQWLLRQRRRVAIENRSMEPLLKPGDEVLYNPNAYDDHLPQAGEIVIVQDPRRLNKLLIKRVYNIPEPDYVDIRGDNKLCSTDSRHFGPVPIHLLCGRVTCRFNG